MIAIGRCLLLFMSLSGLSLSVNIRFRDNDVQNFLDYVLKLHNAVRRKHQAGPLLRTNEMDRKAFHKLMDWENGTKSNLDSLGVVIFKNNYNNLTQLDVAEAITLFSLSYEQGNFYDYLLDLPPYNFEKFTQIVWRDSTHIGLTFSCEMDNYTVLAVYSPPGNEEGTYTLNVQQPINNLPAIDSVIPGLIYQTKKEKFLDNLFELHNQARIEHGVPILRRDFRMDQLADSILMGREDIELGYGMNSLEKVTFYDRNLDDEAAANQVFAKWNNEKKLSDFRNKALFNYLDPLTQILRENTKYIGIGIQQKFNGTYGILVLYYPTGNIPEEYRNMDQGEPSGSN